MNVWILSHLASSDGTLITKQLFKRAGVNVRHVSPSDLCATLTPHGPAIAHVDGGALPDLVYTRLGSSAPTRALDVLRQIEMSGIRCVNGAASLRLSRDKWRSCQVLAEAGLPFPETALAGSRNAIDAIVATIGPPPYVIKLPESSKGTGVTLVESVRSLRATLDLLEGLGTRVLIQRFVAKSAGADTRVLVFGGRAVLAVRRQAGAGEFRSNVYLGGADSAAELPADAARIAEAAARAHGLVVAGVDLLEDDDGYVIAEVNGSPGLAGPNRQRPNELQAAFNAFVSAERGRVCA